MLLRPAAREVSVVIGVLVVLVGEEGVRVQQEGVGEVGATQGVMKICAPCCSLRVQALARCCAQP